jgi:uncharacterized protein involved in exopolysaccharide biosynthesis
MSVLKQHHGELAPMDPQCHRVGVLVVTFVITFLVIFGGFAGYAFERTPLYKSAATVGLAVENVQQPPPAESGATGQPFDRAVQLLESAQVVNAVVAHLQGDDLRRFLAPYSARLSLGQPPSTADLLTEGRMVVLRLDKSQIKVGFVHPNPDTAALVANLYAEAFIVAQSQEAAAGARLVADLQENVQQQHEKLLAARSNATPNPDTIAAAKAQNQAGQAMQTFQIIDKAIPALEPEGLATGSWLWLGFAAGLAGGALATALMAGIMAFRRLPRHLPPMNGLPA